MNRACICPSPSSWRLAGWRSPERDSGEAGEHDNGAGIRAAQVDEHLAVARRALLPFLRLTNWPYRLLASSGSLHRHSEETQRALVADRHAVGVLHGEADFDDVPAPLGAASPRTCTHPARPRSAPASHLCTSAGPPLLATGHLLETFTAVPHDHPTQLQRRRRRRRHGGPYRRLAGLFRSKASTRKGRGRRRRQRARE
nr:unnamed protein product [Digitaria exilis]